MAGSSDVVSTGSVALAFISFATLLFRSLLSQGKEYRTIIKQWEEQSEKMEERYQLDIERIRAECARERAEMQETINRMRNALARKANQSSETEHGS